MNLGTLKLRQSITKPDQVYDVHAVQVESREDFLP
jgi:hypothetical protein